MTSGTSENGHAQFSVIIVGSGIAALVLAMLLEKACIPYDIYERATEVTSLGTYPSQPFLSVFVDLP
jgi:cation diffusion facilitator CzcD-associated flavoprotein CzcO